MAESKVKRENHITIQGWMLTDLNLKGNELLIYAIIYGFSQAENQAFSGSLQYLADWTNIAKESVCRVVKSLVEKGYIIKSVKAVNGIRVCEYYAQNVNEGINNLLIGCRQNVNEGINNLLTNNIEDNIDDNNIYKYIVEYLNSKAETSFRVASKDTRKHIKARLKEGYTLEDFKNVIDKKVKEWSGTEWEQYLRPSTLFGTKFESYLNGKTGTKAGADKNAGWNFNPSTDNDPLPF